MYIIIYKCHKIITPCFIVIFIRLYCHDILTTKERRFIIGFQKVSLWTFLLNTFTVGQVNLYKKPFLSNLFILSSSMLLMPTILVQEHKDKTITHMVYEVLTWLSQPCLRPRMRENNSIIQ